MIIAVVFVIGHMVSDHADSDAKEAKSTTSNEETMKPISKSKKDSSANPISESPDASGESALTTPATDPSAVSQESSATANEQAAVKDAVKYLSDSSYSYSALVDQLLNDGYTKAEAAYGADHCKANWKDQATKKAQSHLEDSSFTHQELIDQLLNDGFTQEEATYGVSSVGL